MELQNDIAAILERNRRVELDKAWERSLTRRGAIAVITYLTALILLWSVGSTQILLPALIPSIGYILSTLSLPWLRRWWMSNRSER